MNTLKESLRHRCLAQRQALTTTYMQSCDQVILTRLAALTAFTQATLVHTYVSAKTNEIDTQALIQHALAAGKRIAVPVVRPAFPHMVHAEINSLEQLSPGHFGLLQPAASHNTWIEDLTQLDLVLVPGLAFDRQGNRLGFGKGYYDRFLARVTALKIGLVQEALIQKEIPHEPHDVLMDIIFTEAQTYYPSQGTGAS